jgi:hypothetical protein
MTHLVLGRHDQGDHAGPVASRRLEALDELRVVGNGGGQRGGRRVSNKGKKRLCSLLSLSPSTHPLDLPHLDVFVRLIASLLCRHGCCLQGGGGGRSPRAALAALALSKGCLVCLFLMCARARGARKGGGGGRGGRVCVCVCVVCVCCGRRCLGVSCCPCARNGRAKAGARTNEEGEEETTRADSRQKASLAAVARPQTNVKPLYHTTTRALVPRPASSARRIGPQHSRREQEARLSTPPSRNRPHPREASLACACSRPSPL